MPNNAIVKSGKKLNSKEKAEVRQMLKSVLAANLELKYYDTNANYAYVPYGGVIQRLSGILQGVTEETRSGNLIKPKHLSIRFSAYYVSSGTLTTATSNVVRVVVLKWLINDGQTAPTMTEIFEYNGSVYGEAINSPFAWNNTKNQQKWFQVLYDKRWSIGLAPGGMCTDIELKLKGTTSFDDTYGTATGNYYLIYYSDDATAFNAGPYMSNFSRFTYTDA
jgi:hypothetical protein